MANTYIYPLNKLGGQTLNIYLGIDGNQNSAQSTGSYHFITDIDKIYLDTPTNNKVFLKRNEHGVAEWLDAAGLVNELKNELTKTTGVTHEYGDITVNEYGIIIKKTITLTWQYRNGTSDSTTTQIIEGETTTLPMPSNPTYSINIIFDPNGGMFSDNTTQPKTVPFNPNFSNWINASGNIVSSNSTDLPTSATTYRATWNPTNLTFPIVSKPNAQWMGWATNKNETDSSNIVKSIITARTSFSTKYYAIYNETQYIYIFRSSTTSFEDSDLITAISDATNVDSLPINNYNSHYTDRVSIKCTLDTIKSTYSSYVWYDFTYTGTDEYSYTYILLPVLTGKNYKAVMISQNHGEIMGQDLPGRVVDTYSVNNQEYYLYRSESKIITFGIQ